MSVVTDIMLVTGIDDGGEAEDDKPNVAKLNAWILEKHGCKDALKKVEQHAGGNKCVQCDVFIAAINYLDHDGLIQAFAGIEWGYELGVQLMLKGEHEDRFTVYELDYDRNVYWHDPDDRKPYSPDL